MAYDFITQSPTIVELRYFNEKRFILSPRHWGHCNLPVVLNWTMVPFRASEVQNIPATAARGVYSFVLQPGIANHPACSYLLYIGKVEDQTFRQRFRQYLREQSDQRPRRVHVSEMLRKWQDHLFFCYAEIPQFQTITGIEDSLLEAYMPPVNRDFPATIAAAIRATL